MARSHTFSRARSSHGMTRMQSQKSNIERILLWPVWECYVRCEREGQGRVGNGFVLDEGWKSKAVDDLSL